MQQNLTYNSGHFTPCEKCWSGWKITEYMNGQMKMNGLFIIIYFENVEN